MKINLLLHNQSFKKKQKKTLTLSWIKLVGWPLESNRERKSACVVYYDYCLQDCRFVVALRRQTGHQIFPQGSMVSSGEKSSGFILSVHIAQL